MLYSSQVRQPTFTTPLSSKIRNNYRYFPYFEDCIGALDGTHVAAYIPLSLQPRYRNRKQFISQNILACCDFDMRFTFLLAGWEGSAHDQRVLQDARYNHGLELPPSKFYLGDAGYSSSLLVMVPYRGVRYHLKEQRQADQK